MWSSEYLFFYPIVRIWNRKTENFQKYLYVSIFFISFAKKLKRFLREFKRTSIPLKINY
jgi:hypothetical protein